MKIRKLIKQPVEAANSVTSEELQETIITLTEEVDFLNEEAQYLEDEIQSQQQVFKKLLLNMCMYDSSDYENKLL